jgi:hypothetical protein
MNLDFGAELQAFLEYLAWIRTALAELLDPRSLPRDSRPNRNSNCSTYTIGRWGALQRALLSNEKGMC